MLKWLLILPINLYAQVGAFMQGSFETFYTWNRYVAVGASIGEHNIGLFHQEATINPDGYYLRQGVFAEYNIGNVDKILYAYAGMRFAQSNDNFWGFTPHATAAWRIKYVEIPISFSIYASRLVGSIGVRVLFRPEPRVKVPYTRRRAFQPTSLEPNPKK
jgi:hypothetical protein